MPEPMLIERLMPDYDATRIEHRVVPAVPEEVWRAVREADFVRTAEEQAAVRYLFGARSAAERLVSSVRGRRAPERQEPDSMRLADMPRHGEWVLLGENPPEEIAFGAIGRFWAGETRWLTLDADTFGTFAEPGLARIACNFSLRPYGLTQTLLSYEARTKGTDEASSAAFMRYWRPLAPFIGSVMRAQLRMVEREVASDG